MSLYFTMLISRGGEGEREREREGEGEREESKLILPGHFLPDPFTLTSGWINGKEELAIHICSGQF